MFCDHNLTERQKKVFELCCKLAIKGERAPTTQQLKEMIKGSPGDLLLLCELGYLRTEVYGKNWRVLEILKGPHKGKRTMESPRGGEPYKCIPPIQKHPNL